MKALDYVLIGIIAALFIIALKHTIKNKNNCCNKCNGDCAACKKKINSGDNSD